PHQQLRPAGTYHRQDLQVPLAGGTVLRELDMVHSFGCHGISRVSCSELTVGGGDGWFRPAAHRSTSSLRRIQGAPTQACVAGNCFTRINRKTVVGVTPTAVLRLIRVKQLPATQACVGAPWILRREEVERCAAGRNQPSPPPTVNSEQLTLEIP